MIHWRRRQSPKPRALAFVDYEYWFYSYKTRFGLKPDPVAWREQLEAKYDIADILVFADFSSPGLSDELNKIREITNTIIETSDDFHRNRKDMTDFVMLDYIYQNVDRQKKIWNYILFTGDGHFQSVVKYLKQQKHKEVILYGIEDSFSKRLLACASETVMLPMSSENYNAYARYIIDNLAKCVDNSAIIPTIKSTSEVVAQRNSLPAEQIRATIFWMMDKGYIYQKMQRVSFNKSVKVVALNWEKLIEEHLWDAEKGKAI